MSIFDQFDEGYLPGDKKERKVQGIGLEDEFDDATNEEILSHPKSSFWFFYLLTLIIMGVLVAQLLRLQIGQGSFNKVLAEGNRIRNRSIQAPRGIIYDRNNVPFVVNEGSFNLEIYPLDLPKKQEDRQKFYQELSSIIQLPEDGIKSAVEEKGFSYSDPVILKENIDRDSAILLETKIVGLPGVIIGKTPVRNYYDIPGMSQVIGYVGKVTDSELKKDPNLHMNEIVGKDGVEKSYQYYLKGKDGFNEIEVDSRGRAQRVLSNTLPQPGNSLTLAIDSKLEESMTRILTSELRVSGVSSGSAVALDPKTGAVLGMVSLPSYDNNIFNKTVSQEDYQKLLSDPSKPMFNRAVSGTYPSGSTIKPVVAAAGLQEGVITENTTISDPGEIKVGSWVYPDWKAHGLVNVRKAISESCNVFFYSVGGGWDKIKGLGVDKLKTFMEKFGLGKALGIDLPSEADGLVPSPAWKEKVKKEMWYLGDTYHMAIGQGDVLVTPLQMASITATIANGGEVLKPFVVQRIVDQSGKTVLENKKEVIRSNVVDAYNLQIVREGMRQSVTSGSSKMLNDLPVMAAAKTGTAQFGSEGKTHGWMIAFAPYDDPQIAIAVLVEEGGEGSSVAAPVIKDIFREYFFR